jgi:hypothetical protein
MAVGFPPSHPTPPDESQCFLHGMAIGFPPSHPSIVPPVAGLSLTPITVPLDLGICPHTYMAAVISSTPLSDPARLCY